MANKLFLFFRMATQIYDLQGEGVSTPSPHTLNKEVIWTRRT
jgi:hypothetical protein